MGGLTLVLLWLFGIGWLNVSMVETRKRKSKRERGEKSLATSSSQSDDAISDDVEVDTRPKPKRKKEHVESSNTSSTKRSSADSGPHKCRFCGQEFKLSQSLGGHMNRHRSEKQDEEMQKAKTLLADRQRYTIGNPWTMQGGDVGGNPYYGGTLLSNPSGPILGTSSTQFYLHNQSAMTLQNSQLNPVLVAQQNSQAAIHSLHGDGYYNPLENTNYPYGTTSQRNVIPARQFQGQHPIQPVYSDVKGSETNTMQPQGQSIFHSNQGGLPDTLFMDVLNMPSNHNQQPSNHNQQVQVNISMTSDQSFHHSAVQFVDQHGNPMQPGGSLGNQSASEHMSRHGVPHMPSLDASQDFQGGTLMDSGQVGFEADTSIDDHT